jgi:hypothetical protein
MNVYTLGCIYSETGTEEHQNVPRNTNSLHADPSIDAPVCVAINGNAAILFTQVMYKN